MNELWKDIKDYEGFYQVSNLGRVRSLKRIDNNNHPVKERILATGKKENGYLIVTLWKNGKGKTFMVHRLVAKTFIPNPMKYNSVNHKDEIKSNNCIKNLEWCTHKYNINYNDLHKRITKKIDYKSIGKKRRKKVYQFDLIGNLIKVWDSLVETSAEHFNPNTISKCCRGELKTYKGYIWSYTNVLKQEVM